VSNIAIAADVFGGGAGAAPPTTPLTIWGASVLFWARPDLGATTGGGTISALLDQSGSGDTNKNATATASQPTYTASDAQYNHQSTFTSAAGKCLFTGTWTIALVQPFTVFFVGHTTDGTASNVAVGSLSANLVLYNNHSSNSFRAYDDGGANEVDSGVSILNTPSACWASLNGAASKIGVRQKTANATADCVAGTCTGLILGAYNVAGGLPLIGKCAEFLVVSSTDATKIGATMDYLGARYAMVIGP
jgi:hypothetical protein